MTNNDLYIKSNTIFDEIETPAVLLDETKMMANLRSMQDLADRNNVALRPHIKTHKSLEIGQKQIELGAAGITVATVDEAIVFLNGGFTSITIARPVVSSSKWHRLLSVNKYRNVDIRAIVDSEESIRITSDNAELYKRAMGLFLKIDVGLNRCGFLPSDWDIIHKSAEMIHKDKYLDFRGLLSHAGHVYGSTSPYDAARIAEDERETMVALRDRLLAAGLPVPEISVGATPAVLATEFFDGITEIRPGNYVFLDLLPARVGVSQVSNVALSVLATVISKNTHYFVTDAGSKTLSSDTGVHGMTSDQGFGLAYPAEKFLDADSEMIVEKVSEEHSMITRTDCNLSIGSKMRLVPVHSCPVVNLARSYVVISPNGLCTWSVDAAGGSK